MLRLAADDPLALSLFGAKKLRGLKKQQRITRGRRAGQITDVQSLCNELDRRGFPEHEREHTFALELGRRWRFDVAWPRYRVALEYEGLVIRRVNGEALLRGRHATITGIREDMVKYNTAAALGWVVLRCEQQLLRTQAIFDSVRATLMMRGAPCP